MTWRLTSIVSGGQTGADRGGLDAARALGLGWGGWAPRDWRAEDGTVPVRYRDRMRTTKSREYGQRTKLNVQNSDGTLLLSFAAALTGGSAFTERLAKSVGKPYAHLVLVPGETPPDDVAAQIREWIEKSQINTLNVAGPRESKEPGIGEAVRNALVWMLADEIATEPACDHGNTAFMCASCSSVFCWTCDAPMALREAIETVEVRTIGSRYCPDPACLQAEATAHGLSLERMTEHRAQWRERRNDER